MAVSFSITDPVHPHLKGAPDFMRAAEHKNSLWRPKPTTATKNQKKRSSLIVDTPTDWNPQVCFRTMPAGALDKYDHFCSIIPPNETGNTV